jgi:hypothetical protein
VTAGCLGCGEGVFGAVAVGCFGGGAAVFGVVLAVEFVDAAFAVFGGVFVDGVGCGTTEVAFAGGGLVVAASTLLDTADVCSTLFVSCWDVAASTTFVTPEVTFVTTAPGSPCAPLVFCERSLSHSTSAAAASRTATPVVTTNIMSIQRGGGGGAATTLSGAQCGSADAAGAVGFSTDGFSTDVFCASASAGAAGASGFLGGVGGADGTGFFTTA